MIKIPRTKSMHPEGRTITLWTFEWQDRDGTMCIYGPQNTRREARRARSNFKSEGIQCGPVFQREITATAWEPKGKK